MVSGGIEGVGGSSLPQVRMGPDGFLFAAYPGRDPRTGINGYTFKGGVTMAAAVLGALAIENGGIEFPTTSRERPPHNELIDILRRASRGRLDAWSFNGRNTVRFRNGAAVGARQEAGYPSVLHYALPFSHFVLPWHRTAREVLGQAMGDKWRAALDSAFESPRAYLISADPTPRAVASAVGKLSRYMGFARYPHRVDGWPAGSHPIGQLLAPRDGGRGLNGDRVGILSEVGGVEVYAQTDWDGRFGFQLGFNPTDMPHYRGALEVLYGSARLQQVVSDGRGPKLTWDIDGNHLGVLEADKVQAFLSATFEGEHEVLPSAPSWGANLSRAAAASVSAHSSVNTFAGLSVMVAATAGLTSAAGVASAAMFAGII